MQSVYNKGLRLSGALVIALACSSPASAYTYWQGKLATVWFSSPGNFAFRVYNDPATPLPGCTANFAYIETTNPNYQVYVSALMTAFTTGKTVHLTYTVDSQGFCSIVEGSVDR